MAKIEDDILVFVPEESRAGKQVVSKAARDIHIDHDPAVKIYYVEVDPPTFEEPTGGFRTGLPGAGKRVRAAGT